MVSRSLLLTLCCCPRLHDRRTPEHAYCDTVSLQQGCIPALTACGAAQPLGGQRQVADAQAGGVEHRVGGRRGRRAPRGLARAEPGLAGTVEQYGIDLGNLAEAQDRIALPVGGGDARAIEGHLLLQGPARGLDEATLELVHDAVGMDDLTGIGGDRGALEPDRGGGVVDGELDAGRAPALLVLVAREGQTAAASAARRAWRGPPAEALGSGDEHVSRA